MRIRTRMIWLGLIALVAAGGCTSDVKNIERINYASAIGIDYRDGKYYSYVQFIDMHSEAKTSEGGKERAKIWLGESKGDNFEDAVFQIYRSAQERIYWGHTTAIVFSESVLKDGFESIYDSITRYYEFRFTPWVYVARGSVKDIMQTGGFYDQSPLNTILHEPMGIYSQTSMIASVKLHRMIREMREPGYTSHIPTISLEKKSWSQNGKKKSMMIIDGAVFVKDGLVKGYIPAQQLSGLRWLERTTIRAGVSVPREDHPAVQMVVDKPKAKIVQVEGGTYPKFDIRVKGDAYVVNESNNSLSNFGKLTYATEDTIRREIEELYETGVKNNLDILNLEYNLFRHHYREWHAADHWDKRLLTGEALRNVDVRIDVTHASAAKNRKRG